MCKLGYGFSGNTGVCVACAIGCRDCATNVLACVTCDIGYAYYSDILGTGCRLCDGYPTCMSCAGNPYICK